MIKSKTFIIVAIMVLLSIAQLFRMDTFVKAVVSDSLIIEEYTYEGSMKLSEEEKDSVANKKFLILYSSTYQTDVSNIEKIFDYLKADYKIVAIDKGEIDLNAFDTLILLEQLDSEYLMFHRIVDYINQGGKLIYLGNGGLGEQSVLKSNADFFGISSWREINKTNNLYFNSEILLGLIGELEMGDDPLDNYYNFEYLDTDLVHDVKIHMEDISGIPIIWELEKGNGKVMVINNGKTTSKEIRGVIVGVISLLEDLFVYPIINSQVMFIDDFPADYNANPELYKVHYGMNTDRFIKEIWWPDMVTLMQKYKLKYTGAYIENYDDKVSGAFNNNDLITNTTKELGAQLLKYGGELSFHGYNHQPLLFKEENAKINGYKSWKKPEDIISSIGKTISGFNSMFPEYKFYTYVPPSNLLDVDAISVLKRALPTMRTISGLYFGELDHYGNRNNDVFQQEIGIDPRYGVALPRISSGAFYDEDMKYSVSSVATMHGLINHFIHPDDVLDPERSLGLMWEDLYKKTDELFGTFDQKYNWIDKDIASIASEKVKQYTQGKIYYDIKGGTINILWDNFSKEASVILATDKKVISSTDCEYIKIGENRYLVKLRKNKVSLEVQ